MVVVVTNGIGLGVFLCLAVRPALPADENFSPFFAFLAKTRPIPQFWYSSSIPASQTKYLLCGPLINFILKAAMSALLPCPSASSAGDRPRRLPLSTLSSPPPLPPQLPPPSAHHHYHRHCCRRCSVSAATARCCHCCCRRRRHHRRRRFCF